MSLVIGFDIYDDAFRGERLMGGIKRGALDRTQFKEVLL